MAKKKRTARKTKTAANVGYEAPFRLLEPVPEVSCGPADNGNLIVQGDNLHALKALRGSLDCHSG